MILHQEEFVNFEQQSSYKSESHKFSFDLNGIINQMPSDRILNNEQSSDLKDKVIIKEPLEVFEVENEGRELTSNYSSDEIKR
jgi:hypothetical protein